MRRQLTAVIATLMLAATPVFAANGNIGLFFDEGGALCQATIPCGGSARLYVYALLQGASGLGITGAEYAVAIGPNTNADPDYGFFNEVFSPGSTVLGSAFAPGDPAPRGVNVAWADCQLGDGTKILIQTVDIVRLACVEPDVELRLRVTKKSFASNQFFQCPLFVLCDAPTYTKVCLGSNLTLCANPEPPFPINATCSTSGEAFINPAPGRNCTVGVAQESWSGVKALFRD